MQNKKNSKKKVTKKDVRLNEFFAEDRFDEEDEDSVTDDTLEFLCLDDEAIESYQKTRKSSRPASGRSDSRYEEDEDDEEDYDDEYYGEDEDDEDDEDYEGEYYAVDEDDEDYGDEDYDEDDEDDEDYDEDDEDDDEDYDDEDDEYEYDDDREGIITRFKYFLTDMSTLDMIVAMLGIVVLAGVLVTATLFVNAKSIEKQVEAFASVGEEVEGISVIGESGLLAVSESAKLSGMIDLPEEEPEETFVDEDQDTGIEVTLNLTSIQSDLKIKFVNKSTGKLIAGVPFEVEVSNGSNTYEWKDDDKDGIIYHTDVEAGTYNVTVKPFSGSEYQDYKLPTSATSVKVTDTIAYKKVDVVDEVKTEAEVNAAVEDTAQQDTVVESALQDTVEWVESTKTPIGDGKEVYEEVDKKNIPDPWKVSSAFVEMVETGIKPMTLEDGDSEETTTSPGDTGDNTGGGTGDNTGGGTGDNTGGGTGDNTGGGTGDNTGGSTGNTGDTGNSGNSGNAGESKELKASLDKSSLSLKVGDSSTLKVNVTSGEGVSTSWKSSNDSVASVDGNGKVTAKSAGSATITAALSSSNGKKLDLTCSVTVVSAYTKITISGDTEVVVGKTITLKAQTEPKDGKVTWSSDNDKVAKVDGSGVVTGVAAGTANIKAVCSDATEISATYKVTVKSAVDGTAKLKDKDGNQMYYKDSSGKYKEATYDDYNKRDKFYKKSNEATEYKYTGWQTIDGSVYYFDKNGDYVTGEQVIQGAKYTFGSDGKLSSGSGTMGIDVSKWNGNIDWNAVKNSGVSYAIIRCGYRGSSTGALIEDPMFRSNIKGAKAAGIKVGVYFFCQAVNEVEAVEEASMAVSLASGYGLDMPIFLDVESSGGRGDRISKETRTAVCKAFCQTVQNSGYSAGVYANKTWFTSYINTGSLTGYKIWLAQYASAPTYTATKYDIWQYSSKGKVSGISGNVDMNIKYY